MSAAPSKRPKTPTKPATKPTADRSEWDGDPVPFDDAQSLPSFPAEAMPPGLCDWACATATDLRVPLDLPAMMGLATVAVAAAKRGINTRVKPGWMEPTNIFVAMALSSGELKSPVFRRSVEPLQTFEHEAIERQRTRIRKLEAAVKKKKDKKTVEELAEAKKEIAPRLLVDDCTPEALAAFLGKYGECAGLLSTTGKNFSIDQAS